MKIAKVTIEMDNKTTIEFIPSHFGHDEVDNAYGARYDETVFSKEEYEKAKNVAKFILNSKF